MKTQRPIPGGRRPLTPYLMKSTARAVEQRAARFHVSKSFVMAVALADVFKVSGQERYDTPRKIR